VRGYDSSVLRIRVLGGIAFLGLVLLVLGSAALAAIVEGQPGAAVPLLMVAVLVAGAMLWMQASLRRRLVDGDRLLAFAIAAGSASLVALLAFLFLAGNIIVGDWELAAASCALTGASGLVAGISL
jgi:hypothetical protein